MTHLVFFEKPGCGGHARQRALLAAAGHTLERFVGLGTPDAQPASREGCAADPARAAPCQTARQPSRQPPA